MSATKQRPTKKQLRQRSHSVGLTAFHPDATSREPILKNGNGSKYDPIEEDKKPGRRQ